MSSFWKVLVVLVLALPVGAYVTGSIIGDRARLPDQRPPVVVNDPSSPAGEPSARPSPSSSRSADDPDDRGDQDRGRTGDDDVEIIRPEPEDVDDDAAPGGDDGGDDDGDDRGRDDRDAGDDSRGEED